MPNLVAEQAAGFLRQVEPVSALEGLDAGRPEPVTGFDALSSDEKQAVEGALGKLADPAAMDGFEQSALEAIIIPDRRPVIDIANDDYAIAEHDWQHLNRPEYRAAILPTLPAIGRLELIGHPGIPYAGTAFLVGPGLLMTNRHVAELFASGLGRDGLAFKPGLSSEINFAEEALRSGDTFYKVVEVLVIHPWWDMAVLRVEGVPVTIRPLTLSRDAAAPAADAPDIVVIGYPAFDPRRNDIDVQRRVFRNLFNVKRLQPGKLLPRRAVASFGKQVEALTHDSSTLGGNSGSAVIDARTGRVMALHFGGRYLETNYGVPAADLALDARLLDLGLEFESGPPGAVDGSWAGAWDALEAAESALGNRPGFPLTPPTLPRPLPVPAPVPAPAPPPAPPPAAAAGDGATFTIPLVITVRSAVPVPGLVLTAAGATSGEAIVEKMAEPWHDDSYRGREGYKADFLGPEVPLPTPLDPKALATLEDGSHVIPYMHFSLAMHRGRRLALYTAANVRADRGSRNPEPGANTTRKGLSGLGEYDTEKWFTDPRLRGLDQLPDKFFTLDRQSFDKGHLVRRDDVAWGETFEELRIANGDTYHVTNCSPQVARFNRAHGGDNWGDLEKAVLAQAVDQRLTVLAGPVLADDDPDFAGVDQDGAVRVQIPKAYWKVVVAPRSDDEGGGLAAFGFLLEQDLSAVDMERLEFDPRWHASMRSLSDLERTLGLLTFPEILHRADRHGTAAAESVAAAAGLED